MRAEVSKILRKIKKIKENKKGSLFIEI